MLCDLMRPDQGGVELHTWLQSARPALADRVVFMTGGVFTPQTREYLERVPNPQVPKPFDIARLRQMVADQVSAARGWPRGAVTGNRVLGGATIALRDPRFRR